MKAKLLKNKISLFNKTSSFMKEAYFAKISNIKNMAFGKAARVLAELEFSLNDANEVYCHYEEGRLWARDTIAGIAGKCACSHSTAKNALRNFEKMGIIISRKFDKTNKNVALSYSIDEIRLAHILKFAYKCLDPKSQHYLPDFTLAKFSRLNFTLPFKKNPHKVLKINNKRKNDNKEEGSFDNSFDASHGEDSNELSKDLLEIKDDSKNSPRSEPIIVHETKHISNVLTFSRAIPRSMQPLIETLTNPSPPKEEPKMYQTLEQQNIIDRFKGLCKLELGDKAFNSWFQYCAWSYSPTDKTIYLKFDKKFTAAWVEGHFLAKMMKLMPEEIKHMEIKS